MDRLSVKAPREPPCTDGEGPAGLRPPGSDHWLTGDSSKTPHSPRVMTACALTTEGMTTPWTWERGWEAGATLLPGGAWGPAGGRGGGLTVPLRARPARGRGWGLTAPLLRTRPRGGKVRGAYCTAQGQAGPGEGGEVGFLYHSRRGRPWRRGGGLTAPLRARPALGRGHGAHQGPYEALCWETRPG